jgi:hypothetical protein
MKMSEILLACTCVLLIVLFLIIFGFACRKLHKIETFEDTTYKPFFAREIKSQIDTFPVDVIILRRYWEDPQGTSVLVTVPPGGEITIESGVLNNPTGLGTMKQIISKLPTNLPPCTFVQSLSDENTGTKVGILQNSTTNEGRGIMSPMWFWTSDKKVRSFTPWGEKLPQGVWRGSTTGKEPYDHYNSRRYLVEKSQNYPNFLDARFSTFGQGVVFDDSYLGGELTPDQQQQHRFIVSKDGNTGTYGLYWQLASGSCLIVNHRYRQWFTPAFKPDIHYLVYSDKPNSEDIMDVLRKAPVVGEEIAKRAKGVTDLIFTEEFCLWYYSEIIRQLSARQSTNV